MNELTKFLVEGILNETTEKVVALFGGGFKPPTKGHLDVVNNGLQQNPEVTEVKILVGGKERDGFTQDQAVKIWNLYNDLNFIGKPATIIPVSSPFSYYKNYLKDNPDDKVYIFIGSREGDEDDKFDVRQRSEFVKKYSDNVIPVEVATAGGVSGTLARKLFKTDMDGFRNMFPENLLDIDFQKILDILNNKSINNTRKSALKSTEPLTPLNEGDPKKGTGKKPKGSGRRLYTDEDPSDTVGVKFSTRQDIVNTLNKKSFKAKSHARQSQIINLIHQRVRAALSRTKDPAKKKKLKSGFEYIKGKKEASKKKTERLRKQKSKNKSINEIGDAGIKIRPWRFDGAKSSYRSAEEFKDFVAKYPDDDEFDGESWYRFTTEQGTNYEVQIDYIWLDSPKYNAGFIEVASVDFYAGDEYDGRIDKSMSMTNKGEVFEVMATITDIVISWLNEWGKVFYIDLLIIEPKLENFERGMIHSPGFKAAMTKRGRLYQAYIEKQISKLDTKYTVNDRKGRFEITPIGGKNQKLKENQMSMEDFNLVAAVLRDKNKAKEIHNLLLQMFPKQKELLDYNYKNDSYAEFKRVIFHIDKYKIEGPKTVQHTKLKLDPEVYKERDRKYEEYAKGKIKKYFRDSDSDPRKLDLTKLPPITIDSNGEVMDGNHRAFLAIKQQKPLKAYQIIDAKNDHPNVEKILNIVGRKNQKENIDPKSQAKHKGKSAPFGSAYEPVDEIGVGRGVQGSRYRAIEKRGDKYYYIQDNPFSPGVRQEFGPYKTKAAAKRKMGTFPPAQNYRDITEFIDKIIDEKLCKRGYNYIAKRKREGEKHNPFLTSRAVKVCKGQIKGSDGKMKKDFRPKKGKKRSAQGRKPNIVKEIGINLSNYDGQILPGDVLRAPKGFPLGGKKLESSKQLKVIKNSREGVNRYKLSLEDKDGKKYSVRNFEMDGEYKGKKLPKWGLVRKSKKNINEIDYDSIFRTEAYLKTNTSQRSQGDILSDIRSLPGVTIVGSKDLPNRPSKNESILSVKVDPYPFTKMDNVSAPEAVDYISSEIRKINGVERFQILKKRVSEGDTYEKMAAKGKKAGSLKQGTVRKRLKIPKDKKIPLSLINKELSRLKKMDKDKDKKGVQLGDKNQKYYKALQLSKTLKTTTNVNESENKEYFDFQIRIKNDSYDNSGTTFSNMGGRIQKSSTSKDGNPLIFNYRNVPSLIKAAFKTKNDNSEILIYNDEGKGKVYPLTIENIKLIKRPTSLNEGLIDDIKQGLKSLGAKASDFIEDFGEAIAGFLNIKIDKPKWAYDWKDYYKAIQNSPNSDLPGDEDDEYALAVRLATLNDKKREKLLQQGKISKEEFEEEMEDFSPTPTDRNIGFSDEVIQAIGDPLTRIKGRKEKEKFFSFLNENATYSNKIDYKQQIKDLTKHMIKKGMNILPLPRVIFKHSDVENASQFLGKTAYYSPSDTTIVLYTEGRHPKDITRSFAHEMIHHIQNLEGRLENINTTNTNDDDHLNDIEREAYTRGNMVFRNWTDNMDGTEVSSLNEGPQFGVLYHYTEFLLNILDDNMLRGPISLTRSRDSFVKDWLGSIPILVLDKDKLRTKYKIKPYQDYDDDDAERSEDEMEEVIDTNVTNLSKYIIKVILPKPNEEYEDALKEKGIPYEIDKPLNEKKKPYKHKSGFNDKLGKDPFGLNQYARELVKEVFSKTVTIDMDLIIKALEFEMPTGQETDENVIAIIDAAPAGKVPHSVFLDFYAKFDKYFGEENDSRMLDNFGLEYLLSNVLDLPNEDIQIVMNHYNTTDQDSVEWFEQHDNELEKDEEYNIPGFNDTDDNFEDVINYRRKQLAKSLEEQEKVRIFNKDCGCDKA